jgi:subtilisin-like proprotein convertase family protein
MKNLPLAKTISLLFSALLLAQNGQSQVYYPKRNFVSESAGYLQSFVDGGWYRGSGCIVRDPRLVYSCAHVLFEDGLWATKYRFNPGYNGYYSPTTTSGIAPRGFRYFTNYASNDNIYGGTSPRTYSLDFTVFYNNTNFGTAVGWWTDGGTVLRSNKWKRVVGYPADIDYTGATGRAYQHSTDWFTNTGYIEYGAYHGFDRVSTGGGNSGGPVFVYDGAESYYAGVLVSGTDTTCGVRATDTATNKMATDALAGMTTSGTTRTYSNTTPLLLPDGATIYSTRSVNVSGFSGTIQNLYFSTNISTTYRGDLDVYLRSPTGRIQWISKRAGGSADNLIRTNANFSTTFKGYAANGRWDLKLRDASALDRATFRSFSVKITAP